KSRSLMERVVSDLQLNVRYFIKGKVKETELYKEIPFNFHLSPYPEDSFKKNYKYKIVFDQNNLIQIEDNFGLNKNIRYGDTITLRIGKAVLTPNNNIRLDDEYCIQITSPDIAVENYMAALSVVSVNKQVSLIELTLKEELPKKGEDILNKLIEVYLQSNVEDRNIIADSTMSFIDSRLALVGQELTDIEQNIEEFKRANELADMSEQSRLLLSRSNDNIKQYMDKQVQLE